MWRLLKWCLVGLVLLLIGSDIELSTSLYRYQDNRVEIAFPRWESQHPWATFSWHAGESRFHWYGLAGKPVAEPL